MTDVSSTVTLGVGWHLPAPRGRPPRVGIEARRRAAVYHPRVGVPAHELDQRLAHQPLVRRSPRPACRGRELYRAVQVGLPKEPLLAAARARVKLVHALVELHQHRPLVRVAAPPCVVPPEKRGVGRLTGGAHHLVRVEPVAADAPVGPRRLGALGLRAGWRRWSWRRGVAERGASRDRKEGGGGEVVESCALSALSPCMARVMLLGGFQFSPAARWW